MKRFLLLCIIFFGIFSHNLFSQKYDFQKDKENRSIPVFYLDEKPFLHFYLTEQRKQKLFPVFESLWNKRETLPITFSITYEAMTYDSDGKSVESFEDEFSLIFLESSFLITNNRHITFIVDDLFFLYLIPERDLRLHMEGEINYALMVDDTFDKCMSILNAIYKESVSIKR